MSVEAMVGPPGPERRVRCVIVVSWRAVAKASSVMAQVTAV
jgi:hypothetical protein